MSEGTVQIFVAVCSVVASGLAMQKRKYTLRIKAIDHQHAQNLKIVDENVKLERVRNFSNNKALSRLEHNKHDIFQRFQVLETKLDRVTSKIEWLEEIIPQTHDLLQKIHQHFEKARARASEVKELGPQSVLVRDKKESKS